MFQKTLLAVFVCLILVVGATAGTITVTPSNLQGWSSANVTGGGTVDINGTYPQSGNGSLEFTSTGSSSKADFVHAAGGDLLSTLTSLSLDLYRDSSSTAGAHLAPAVRLFVDNGQSTDRFSYLIWEPVYNGTTTFPTDTWTTENLLNGNFWERAFKSVGPNKTIDIYNLTLANWLSGSTFTDGDGDVSNVVGPNAVVLGYEIGVGSGWSGTFTGAADNFTVGYNGGDPTTYNFETDASTAVPEPASMVLIGSGLAAAALKRKRNNKK